MCFSVPYGNSRLTFDVPWGADCVAIAADHPAAPIDLTIPLLDIGGCTHAWIVFTDATRQSPDQWFVERILRALPLPADRVRLMCAVGMHRPSTQAEKITKLGQRIVEQYQVVDHDPSQVITIGEIDGIPVEVNPALVEPGTFLVVTGVVEPHQYAGYSGGAKTAVIGCGGAGMIGLTHGPAMLDRPGVRLGAVAGNPFQEFVRRAGALIGVDVVINAVMPVHDVITHAAWGGIEIHDQLVAAARALYEIPVPRAPYDLVIAGVGAPKDANLYQASRAATYIGLSQAPVIRRGGVILVPAALPEGIGTGTGEQNFTAILRRLGPTGALIQSLRTNGCQPGEQRAYMIALLLAACHCIVVGSPDPALVTGVGLRHAPSMEAALEEAVKLLGVPNPKTLIVPDALRMIPIPDVSIYTGGV
jgi:nickel-dependent lactate racemase